MSIWEEDSSSISQWRPSSATQRSNSSSWRAPAASRQQQQPASACPARSFCVAAADVLLGCLLSCHLEPPCDREGVPPLYARAKFAAAAGVQYDRRLAKNRAGMVGTIGG